MLGWLVIIVALVGCFALILQSDATMFSGLDVTDIAALLIGGCFLLGFWALLAGVYRGRLLKAVHDATVWLAICLALMLGYNYREEFAALGRRLAGELRPPGAAVSVESPAPGKHIVHLRRRPGSGHFVATVTVERASVSMLVDTGASSVVLTLDDARRAGIDTSRLSYSVRVQTANGITFVAPVRLKHIAIGPIVLKDVDAVVSKKGALRESLLGMTFLQRLRSYEFSGDRLTLRS
ncbi:MAG: retropepsin-like aspartic protease family protein [Hyphomicrobiaceae bacterium]